MAEGHEEMDTTEEEEEAPQNTAAVSSVAFSAYYETEDSFFNSAGSSGSFGTGGGSGAPKRKSAIGLEKMISNTGQAAKWAALEDHVVGNEVDNLNYYHSSPLQQDSSASAKVVMETSPSTSASGSASQPDTSQSPDSESQAGGTRRPTPLTARRGFANTSGTSGGLEYELWPRSDQSQK